MQALAQQTRTVAPGRQRTVAVAARKAAGKTAAKTTRAAPKQAAKGAAYICLDCGWVYSGQDGPFEKLPRNYKCPVCLSPKSRFVPKDQPKRSSAIRRAEGDGVVGEEDKSLLLAAAGGAAVLLGLLYFVLNSQVSP
ncbi:hypothetical protein MNEG_3691 [Monoraphidium neglectum]|uniref:Rubredoxin-like domain-containing protein n=1 Tax=Monoraphidium neglectum TaxID=145388 RepID=A0A0D2MNI2_9CHLO|nr:hypothetical protein MNEG_3691 [Monoraphidium neglectum]KIZ04265.1 hypothetical protein MNEG_3691 [Monoraphidium neglectum]|eukprot:XP_013903284.1 hypothetical protein MNEG_3691 [Monoraphidium neglectum]